VHVTSHEHAGVLPDFFSSWEQSGIFFAPALLHDMDNAESYLFRVAISLTSLARWAQSKAGCRVRIQLGNQHGKEHSHGQDN
jgi:hypothetical protein